MSWRNEFRIHLEDVEVQHRRLTGLVEALLTTIEDGRPPRIVRAAFADLVNYMELHFSDEEEFMKRAGYPQPLLESHCQAHSTILGQLQRLRTQFDRGDPVDLTMPATLSRLLGEEEAEHDKRYLDYLRVRAGI